MSLEKAMALKSAGLQWEPDFGDLYWREECNSDMIYCGADPDEDDVWLPRLDQLLAEIEDRGFKYICHSKYQGKYEIEILKTDKSRQVYIKNDFVEDTPEDAATDALIWILTKGGLPMGD